MITTRPFTRRKRAAWVLALLALLFASCVTQNPDIAEPEEGPPLVAKQRPIPPPASDQFLAKALEEYAGDPAVRTLIDAVRTYSSAPLTAGNKVIALVDGPQTFAELEAAVRAARRHVHVETFIFGGDDEVGRGFSRLLVEKHKQGVEIRVLYDSIGSMETPRAFFDDLRAQGVAVREFRPMNPLETPLLWKVQNRDHKKIIVVDGRIGFTGGINIDGTYSSSSASKPGPHRGVEDGWRDTHVRIDGPAVAQLQALFLETWNKAGEKEAFDHETYFPTLPPQGKQLVTIVANDSEDDDRSLYGTYLAAFRNASSRLWITHAYFAPNDELLEAMTEAAKRGVDVRMIAPGFTDSGVILQATRSTYARLMNGGVRIYVHNDALLHAKSVVVDGVMTIIGSANLDMRSFVHNDEANAIVISRDFGRRMEEIFERDQRASDPLDPEKWDRRSLWQRLREFAARTVGYWL